MDKEYTNSNLLNSFDDINISMYNNNLCIKDKILKKMNLIKTLSINEIDILNYNTQKKEGLIKYLQSISCKFTTIKKKHNYLNNKLNNKLNIILGEIIHNAYLTSGFHILISNMPELATQIHTNNKTMVDEEVVYDTIEHYIGKNTVISIIKIDNNKYLAKLTTINDARYLCSIIHKMRVETNIINVEMLEHLENCFNDEQITIEKNNNNNNTNNNNTNSDTISDFYIINDNDISDYGYANINIKNKNKTLIEETYLELIYSKINYVLSYFWKK